MNRMLNFISVQSRKGGVGKTTVAYNIARSFLKNDPKTAVLIIDLDFFGTDVTVSTSFKDWFPDSHPVRYSTEYNTREESVDSKDKGNEQANDQGIVNLLELFNDHYTHKKRLPNFSSLDNIKSSTTTMVASIQGVNLLGSSSQIVDSNQKVIEQNPSVLFDPIVGFWFIRFVMLVVQRFYEFARYEGFNTAIVFDNSPGHMGLVPQLEDYLLDFGPNITKFVFVCTNHESDIKESFSGIQTLHDKLSDRLSSLKEASGLDNNQKQFLSRFFESTRDHNSESTHNSDGLSIIEELRFQYYADFINDQCATQLYPSEYIGVIFNKVLLELFSGEHTFKIAHIIGNYEVIRELLTDKKPPLQTVVIAERNTRNYMVPKSELLEWPYLGLQESKKISIYPERIVEFKRAPKTHFTYDNNSFKLKKSALTRYNDSKRAICRTANRYNIVIERMKSNKLGFIARQFPSSWGLSAAFDTFVSLFEDYSGTGKMNQWTLGADPDLSTNEIRKELKNTNSKYIVKDSDTFLVVTFKILCSIIIDKLKLGIQKRKSLDEMFATYLPIITEVGANIPYNELNSIEYYIELLNSSDEYHKLAGEDYVVPNPDDFLDTLLKVLLRFMYCELHLEQYSKLVVGILDSFRKRRKMKKDETSYTLFLSSMYIHLGNRFILEQSIGESDFLRQLQELKDGTTDLWRMPEFESVITRIRRQWEL